MPNRVGQQLGKYHLLELLGSGGFAEVYRAEHIYLGTQHAIKVLHAHLTGEKNIQKFNDEARQIAHLQHPHVVRVTYFDIEKNTPFLVMDYAPNGSLRKYYPEGTRIPALTAVSYIKQVAGALQFAHSKELVHRDVKPENILLGSSNEALLSDFGLITLTTSYRLG